MGRVYILLPLMSLFCQSEANSDFVLAMLDALSSNIPSGGVDHISFVLQEDSLSDMNLDALVRLR